MLERLPANTFRWILLLSALGTLQAGPVGLAQDQVAVASAVEIDITSSRALGEAVRKLAKDHGMLVSYEEAPAEFSEDVVPVVRSGRVLPYGVARKYSLELYVARADSPSTVLQGLVSAHEAADGVGRYEVREWGSRAGVVPVRTRNEFGVWQRVQPLLDTPVSLVEGDRSPAEGLQELTQALSDATGFEVSLGTTIRGPSSGSRVHGVGVPARTLLIALLDELEPTLTWRVVTQPGTGMWSIQIIRAMPTAAD